MAMGGKSGGGKRIRAGEAMLAASGGKVRVPERLKRFAAAVKLVAPAFAAHARMAEAISEVFRTAEAEGAAEFKREIEELRGEYALGRATVLAAENLRSEELQARIRDAERLFNMSASLGDVMAQVAAVKRASPKVRKQKRIRKPGPLTVQQKKAMELWAECKGNFSEVARGMGLDRKTAKQHVEAGLLKFGAEEARLLLAKVRPPKFQKIPEDHRGQALLAAKKVDSYSFGRDPDEDGPASSRYEADEPEEDDNDIRPDEEYVDDRGQEDDDEDSEE